MSTFDEREQAFENKFRHDQDMLFKINSLRTRLIGLWAAKRLGITGDEAEAYALEVISADIIEPENIGIIRKLQSDFKVKGVKISDHRIGKELERQRDVARKQLNAPAMSHHHRAARSEKHSIRPAGK